MRLRIMGSAVFTMIVIRKRTSHIKPPNFFSIMSCCMNGFQKTIKKYYKSFIKTDRKRF